MTSTVSPGDALRADDERPAVARPSLCITNYNGERYLPDSLGLLRARRHLFGETVLVDDASTDDSIAVAREVWPDLRIIRRRGNGGPAAARNAGAAALSGRRILFIDNDVLPEAGCVRRLEDALDADQAAVMAVPRVVHAHDPDRIQFEGGEAHISGLQILRKAERDRNTAGAGRACAVTSLISACFLFDRERWGRPPLFDERFPIYLEDHELGLRASLRGLKVLAVPKAVCRHGAGTPDLSIRETGRATPARVRNTMLNRWQVLLKLFDARTLLLMAPSLFLFEIFQLAGAAAVGWLAHWRAAAAELLHMLPDLLRRRHEFQRSKRLPDRAVLRPGPHPFSRSLAGRRSVRVLRRALDGAAAVNWAAARPLLRRG